MEDSNELIPINDNSNIVKLNSIPKLNDYLAEMERMQGQTALGYALQAQLQVLQVIQSPQLYKSAFDILIQSLDNAINMAENDFQKKLIQEKAAIMINSMIFFIEAKIHYEKKKWTDEGLNLLKQGCNMLADSVPSIVNIFSSKVILNSDNDRNISNDENEPDDEQTVKKSNHVGLPFFVDGLKIFEILTQDRTFINRIIDFFAIDHDEEIRKMKEDFNKFMLYVLDNLSEEKEMFGKSKILAGLFDRYKDIIVESDIKDVDNKSKNITKPKKPRKPSLNIPYKPLVYSYLEPETFLSKFHISGALLRVCIPEVIIIILLFIVYGIMKLIGLIPSVNNVDSLSKLWTIIIFGMLLIPLTLIIILFLKLIGNIQSNNNYKKAKKYVDEVIMPKYEIEVKEIKEEYKSMLKDYELKIEKYNKELEAYNQKVGEFNSQYEDDCNQIKDKYESVVNYFKTGNLSN